MRKTCFSRSFTDTTLHVANTRDVNEDVIPSAASKCYTALQKNKSLSDTVRVENFEVFLISRFSWVAAEHEN